MTTATTQPSGIPAYHWWLVAACGALALLLQLWLFNPIVDGFFPSLDEIPVQMASTPIGGAIDPLSWLTLGFHGYFVPFPEWQEPGAEFWRPLVNAYYWFSYQIFGDRWGGQLILGYAAHALVVALICYVALRVLRLNLWLTAAAVLIAAFNPAYVHQDLMKDPLSIPRAIQFPIYQIEVLDALLVVLGFLAFLKRRFWLFGVLATMALLLKDTALSAPLSALALTGVWLTADRRQSSKNLLWLMVPLLVWSAGRLDMLLQYGSASLTGGTPLAWPLQPLRHLLLWPTGLFQTPMAELRSAVAMHRWSALAMDGADIAVNFAWWAALGFALLLAARKWGQLGKGNIPQPWMVALVFALGNLLFVLLLPSNEVRFGYLWFALGPVAVFAGISRARGAVAVALALTLALVVPQLHSLSDALSGSSISLYSSTRRSARQLTSLLGALPASVTTAYLLDDMEVQTSSPEYFARFSGFRGRLILINNLAPMRGCEPLPPAEQPYRLIGGRAGEILLQYHAPKCFRSAWNVPPLQLFDQDNVIGRGATLSYYYPDLSTKERKAGLAYELGRRFTVRSNDPACRDEGACVWLGFDPAAQQYYVLPLESVAAVAGRGEPESPAQPGQ